MSRASAYVLHVAHACMEVSTPHCNALHTVHVTGHHETQLVMPIIDTDGDGKFNTQELLDFVKLASVRSSELTHRIALAASRCAGEWEGECGM